MQWCHIADSRVSQGLQNMINNSIPAPNDWIPQTTKCSDASGLTLAIHLDHIAYECKTSYRVLYDYDAIVSPPVIPRIN